MRSEDPRLPAVLAALARPIAEIRVMLDQSLGREERSLDTHSADPALRSSRARAELGGFGEARIDAAAWAGLLDSSEPPLPASPIEPLRDALDQGEALFVGEVPSGGDLGGVLNATITRLRTALSAAGRRELRTILPLVIVVDGADLHPGAIADYCDARLKLVLLVRGPSAPAPLARLITPGTLVLQTSTPAAVELVAEYPGPAVAALVPESAARFLHDPRGGKEPWQRIRLDHLPEPPRRGLGRITTWQQTEDLRLLAALAQPPAGAGAMEPARPSSDAELVDRLTAWLLTPVETP